MQTSVVFLCCFCVWVFLATHPVQCATFIEDTLTVTSNTTWTTANSPYHVMAPVLVEAGTLAMEPGTVVYLNSSSIASFSSGRIVARNMLFNFGITEGNSVLSLQAPENLFEGVIFYHEAELPKQSNRALIYISSGRNTFSGCAFHTVVQMDRFDPYNKFDDSSFHSKSLWLKGAEITNSKFFNDEVTLAGSVVTNNEFRNIRAVTTDGGIRNNYFIAVDSIILAGEIEDNIFTDGECSITLQTDGTVLLTGNYFYNLHKFQINLRQAAPSAFFISNNVFDVVAPYPGDSYIISGPSYWNGLTVNATNNYWNGAVSTSQINSMIYDYRDNIYAALVVYNPVKTSYVLPKFLKEYYQISSNDTMCHGYSPEDSLVCSGHGNCVGENDCSCFEGFTGSLCDVPLCYGFPATNSSVCSGNGACVSPDNCQCTAEYYGLRCQVSRCTWNVTGFGAPTPVTTAEWDSEGISFLTKMQNNPNNLNLVHYITMVPFTGDMSIFTEHSATQIESHTSCYNQYSLNVAWNSSYITSSLNPSSQIMEMNSKFYMHFVDTVEETVVSFEYSQKIYATMYSHAVSVFNTNSIEIAKLRVKSIFPQSTAIVIVGDMTLLSGYTLNNLELTSTTAGSGFVLSYTPNSQNVYNFRIVSRPGQQVVTGTYFFDADISHDGVPTTYSMEIDVTYSISIPAPLPNITYKTEVAISDAYGAPKMVFENGERAYVSTVLASDSPKLMNTQTLQTENVYLCCMKNNGPMPQYNPSVGMYGCTDYNPSTMDKWIQLVSNRNASEIATIIPSSNPSKTSTSFDVSLFTDKDRTCYIHVHTTIQTQQSRSLRGAAGDEQSHNYALFQTVVSSRASSASNPNYQMAFWICFVSSIYMVMLLF